MFTGQVAVISNKATWVSDTYELEDEEDGSTIDLASTAYTVAITFYIKDLEGCTRLTGSLTDGKVIIDGPGFHWQFEDTDLNQFCAGTYKCGAKITINGFITDIIVGDVAIIEGN
ncbi:hypothetical protein [Bradyrhizobium sp. C9]|uniref:hypothetical protein n=1 Tax=Bradyrhizobium sp. C9 TaxID=142585 RepID=UPI000BEA0B12|nr:hypothetical protein [Bradyrhizobium sp. C9]PDT74118.1 hypothetical protein CO675_26980 [Bradyrhizobium sp. C9]